MEFSVVLTQKLHFVEDDAVLLSPGDDGHRDLEVLRHHSPIGLHILNVVHKKLNHEKGH